MADDGEASLGQLTMIYQEVYAHTVAGIADLSYIWHMFVCHPCLRVAILECVLAGALMYPFGHMVSFLCCLLASDFASFEVMEAAVDVLHLLFVTSPGQFIEVRDWGPMCEMFQEMRHCTDAALFLYVGLSSALGDGPCEDAADRARRAGCM
jgi:hypothetical protein